MTYLDVKRCNKCVLPETTPGITFNNKGVCNYCNDYIELKNKIKGEPELIKLLNQQKNEKNNYDCMVTLSGGRDSTYTLLKLVKDYGLKVLTVNYENPFTDIQAKKNIQNAVKILNVDHISFKLKHNIHERTFENNILAWFKKPLPSIVPIMCVACKTIWYDIIMIARRNNINCIISGGNLFEDVSYKKVLLGLSQEEKIEKTFIKSIFGIFKDLAKNISYFKLRFIPIMIKGYLFGDQYCLGSRLLGHKINNIDLFHFIKWDEQEVLSRISSELKWDYPRDVSSWRFDCQIECLKDLMYLKTLGVTQRDDFYSKMIREGLLTRKDALKRLEKENEIHYDRIIENIISKTKINKSFFLSLLKKKLSSKRDYP